MTRSKLAAAMVAGFLMGQASTPCDRAALPVPCRCEDAAAARESTPAHAPDGRTTPSRGTNVRRARDPGPRASRPHRIGKLTVGWVERSETHHGLSSTAPPVVGFAALNPPYKNWMSIDEIGFL
jgi:hypothetical protein